MEEVKIFGHKNPDTDTILSSLILEGLEKTLGIYNVKAYRLGNVNKETPALRLRRGTGRSLLLLWTVRQDRRLHDYLLLLCRCLPHCMDIDEDSRAEV